MDTRARPKTFIVRLTADGRGGVVGVVERVASGEKERVQSFAAIGPLMARMFRDPEEEGTT